jgi:hypothetical protein
MVFLSEKIIEALPADGFATTKMQKYMDAKIQYL